MFEIGRALSIFLYCSFGIALKCPFLLKPLDEGRNTFVISCQWNIGRYRYPYFSINRVVEQQIYEHLCPTCLGSKRSMEHRKVSLAALFYKRVLYKKKQSQEIWTLDPKESLVVFSFFFL